MNERELEVAMMRDRIDHAQDVIADLRDALAKIYAYRGEDKFIAETCDPLLTKYEQGYCP